MFYFPLKSHIRVNAKKPNQFWKLNFWDSRKKEKRFFEGDHQFLIKKKNNLGQLSRDFVKKNLKAYVLTRWVFY